MNIVVLAGGLSTERDVSFKTGDMVTKALRKNGHQVILLDVFMGYGEEEQDITGIFEHSEEASVKVTDIPETAPDLDKVRKSKPLRRVAAYGGRRGPPAARFSRVIVSCCFQIRNCLPGIRYIGAKIRFFRRYAI